MEIPDVKTFAAANHIFNKTLTPQNLFFRLIRYTLQIRYVLQSLHVTGGGRWDGDVKVRNFYHEVHKVFSRRTQSIETQRISFVSFVSFFVPFVVEKN
jgi:hypothetical protein